MVWSPEGRAELRAIDRETAMQILHCVDRYLANRCYDGYEQIVDVCCNAWNAFTQIP